MTIRMSSDRTTEANAKYRSSARVANRCLPVEDRATTSTVCYRSCLLYYIVEGTRLRSMNRRAILVVLWFNGTFETMVGLEHTTDRGVINGVSHMPFKNNILAVGFLVATMTVALAAGGGGGAGGAGGASSSGGTGGTGAGGPGAPGATSPGSAASPQMTPGSASNPRPGCTGGSSAMTSGNGQSNTQTATGSNTTSSSVGTGC